jgi:hypothetical protein
MSTQLKIYLERAGLITEMTKSEKQKIEDFVKRLEAEDEKNEDNNDEDDEFPDDENDYYGHPEDEHKKIDESTKRSTSDAKTHVKDNGKITSNSKGVLHELLVGYHLRGKKHMEKHADKEGDSPKKAHDKIKSQLHPDEYKKLNDKAKSAADHIRKHIEKSGRKIHDVHWTSKPGDTYRSTGIKASQKEDASDIVVHSHKGNKTKYHGVSLKVTDDTNKHITASNPGLKANYSAEHIVHEHRIKLHEKYPELANTKNKKERSALMKKNSEMKAHVTAANKETAIKLAAHTHHVLSTGSKHDLVNHIKTHVLQSNKTPMEHLGHEHIRHTTYMAKKADGGGLKHESVVPSEHWNHKLHDHENVTVEHKGTTLHFKHKGVTFATHRMRPSSISDPSTSFKGDGKAHDGKAHGE